MASCRPIRDRLRSLRRLPLSGFANHSWRVLTFQMARFDMGAVVLAKSERLRKDDVAGG